ncbi:MAG: hypothetical protein IK055_04260 [Lachnospiraceae bacterium]|nr:hypothetical protein [Lachnospiraceae bacterium]
MGKPYWMKKKFGLFNSIERVKKKLDTETEENLHRAYEESPNGMLRGLAIDRINDQDYLKSIAVDITTEEEFQIAAARRITDVRFLAQLALQIGESYVHQYAGSLVHDKFDEEFRNGGDWNDIFRLYAELIRGMDGDYRGPKEMARFFTEREDLIRTLLHDRNGENKLDAYMQLEELGFENDPEILKIAERHAHGKEPYTRWGAVCYTDNQDILAEAALHEEIWEIRKSAVRRLTKQDVLAQVAINDRDEEIRELAESMIENPKYLKKAKKNHEHDFKQFILYEKNDAGQMERLAQFQTCSVCGQTYCMEKLYQEEPFCDYTWSKTHIESFQDAERVALKCAETGDSYYGYLLGGGSAYNPYAAIRGRF